MLCHKVTELPPSHPRRDQKHLIMPTSIKVCVFFSYTGEEPGVKLAEVFDASDNKNVKDTFQLQLCLSKFRNLQNSCSTTYNMLFFCHWTTTYSRSTASDLSLSAWWRAHIAGMYILFYSVGLFKEQHETFSPSHRKENICWLTPSSFLLLFLESQWYFPWHFSSGCCKPVADLFQPEWKARPHSLASFNGCCLDCSIVTTMMLLSDLSSPHTSCRSASDLVFIFSFSFSFLFFVSISVLTLLRHHPLSIISPFSLFSPTAPVFHL